MMFDMNELSLEPCDEPAIDHVSEVRDELIDALEHNLAEGFRLRAALAALEGREATSAVLVSQAEEIEERL